MKLVVVVGPSGSGKTAITKELLKRYPDEFRRIITDTSRKMRDGETDGVDYYFRTLQFFEKNKADYLEQVTYGENRYGTRRSEVERDENGKIPLIVMDIEGARTMRQTLGRESVFVVAIERSKAAMERAILARNISEKEKNVRKAILQKDIANNKEADYILKNNKSIKTAAETLRVHILSQREVR